MRENPPAKQGIPLRLHNTSGGFFLSGAGSSQTLSCEGRCRACEPERYTPFMRFYSLLFALISLVMLVMFSIYVLRGPVDPLIAAGLFVSFLACAAPTLLLLKPFDPPEELRRREEARRERARQRGFTDSRKNPPEDRGS